MRGHASEVVARLRLRGSGFRDRANGEIRSRVRSTAGEQRPTLDERPARARLGPRSLSIWSHMGARRRVAASEVEQGGTTAWRTVRMTILASRRVLLAGVGMAIVVAGCGASESPAPSASAAASTASTEAPSPSAAAEPSATVAPSPSPSSAATIYVVRKGDTLIAIAKKQHVTLAALRAANPQVTDPRKLHPGDKLTIPAH